MRLHKNMQRCLRLLANERQPSSAIQWYWYAYAVRDSPGSRTPKYTSYGRLKIFSEKMASDKHWVPGPHHVINDRLQCHTVGLNDRSFTKGERMDLSKPANDYPGPSYTILGFCNKFNRIRHKHEKSTGRKWCFIILDLVVLLNSYMSNFVERFKGKIHLLSIREVSTMLGSAATYRNPVSRAASHRRIDSQD